MSAAEPGDVYARQGVVLRLFRTPVAWTHASQTGEKLRNLLHREERK